MKSCNRCMIS